MSRLLTCVGGGMSSGWGWGFANEMFVRLTHREMVARGRAGRKGRVYGESSGRGRLRRERWWLGWIQEPRTI